MVSISGSLGYFFASFFPRTGGLRTACSSKSLRSSISTLSFSTSSLLYLSNSL